VGGELRAPGESQRLVAVFTRDHGRSAAGESPRRRRPSLGAAIRAVIFLGLCALLSSALLVRAAALDLGAPCTRTPYDAYLGPVWEVFQRLGGDQPDRGVVEKLVQQGHAFRYYFNRDQPYKPQTPAETESSRSGDCKAKSLWLASKMGTRKVRFVIGKAKQVSNMSHAWLIWESPEGWLILDATLFSRPLNPERVSSDSFIPTYSYSSGGKYAHTMGAAQGGGKYADHL